MLETGVKRCGLVALMVMTQLTRRVYADDLGADMYGGDANFDGGDEYGGMDEYGGYGGYGDDEYDGGTDASPSYEEIEDVEGMEAFLKADDTEPAVLGYFDESRDETAIELFKELADAHRNDFRFAYSVDADVLAHYKYAKNPTVTVHPPGRFVSAKYGDKPKARYPSSKLENKEAVAKFLYKKSMPLVGQKTWKSGERYEKTGLPVLTLFAKVDLEKNPKGFEYFANRVRKVAVDYSKQMAFNVGDKDDFSYSLADYGFEDKLEGRKDVGVGVKHGDKYYKMDAAFSVDNLRAFVADVLDGKLQPKVKEAYASNYDDDADDDASEESDDMYVNSNVVSLTTDSFADLTADKDAFLEFYAPWCGHCKSLKPTYKKLADAVAANDHIVVAAMDATAHTPPSDFDVQGYPTLFFKPQNRDPIPYDDDRDLDSMLAFIKKHGTGPGLDEL